MAGRPLGAADARHVHAYLSEDTARMARKYATQTGQSLSSVVDNALRQLFVRLAFFERVEMNAIVQQLATQAAGQLAAERSQ